MSGFAPAALGPGHVDQLRTALRDADFTVDAVAERLGAPASAALARNATTPALRATGSGDSLDTLTRLFTLQVGVTSARAAAALPTLVEPLRAAGVLAVAGEEVRACVDLRPYGDEWHDWWVVSDLTPGLDGRREGPIRPDHVLGVSAASTTLAQLTPRAEVVSALDIGTGSGVQALHLGTHAERVVGTDVNPRARAMARLTAALNGVEVDVRAGSLFEPVLGEAYDLVVTNPPFVVSAATETPLQYRDSGWPGDDVVRRLVTEVPARLNPGGWCVALANWVHDENDTWQGRLSGWLTPTGCDAWVVQREPLDPPAYVETWLADAGLLGSPEYASRYDREVAWFEQERIEAVGFGWLFLRRTGSDAPAVRIEEWLGPVEQPLGPHVAAWGRRVDTLRGLDDASLLRSRLLRAADVVQETTGRPGAADPDLIRLRQQSGMRRTRRVDTVEAAVVGACEGDLALGQVLDAVATLLGRPADEARTTYLPVVRDLMGEGWLDA